MKKRFCIAVLGIALFFFGTPTGNFYASAASTESECMVSAAWEQTAILTPQGYVLIAGNNEVGQIGNSQKGDGNWDTYDSLVLKHTAVMNDVQFISIENLSSYAIKNDHTLWSWGFDHCEALGNGKSIDDCVLPTKILDQVKFVATGHGLHMFAIKEDNSLWGWGQNDYGQVGNGTKTDVASPVKVMSNIKFAAVGYGNSAVIKSDNSLWMWGRNDHGELGNGTRHATDKPFKVMDNVKTITMGFHRSCALKYDGTVWVWGQNDHGEIGDGTTKERYTPIKILSGVSSITSKADGHMMAIKNDGSLWAWGDNENGQLGDGTTKDRYKPVKVLTNVKMVDTSDDFTIALKKDNTIWVWGNNNAGQLGTGDKKPRLQPTKIFDFSKASANESFTKPILFLDGNLEDWGNAEPVIQDPLSDISNKIDLKNIYGFMDKEYVYLAVQVSGDKPVVHISFDNNGDSKGDFDAEVSYNRNIMYTSRFSNNKWTSGPELLTFNYNQGTFEIMIPVSVIGNPKSTSIWVCASPDGNDITKDDSGGWVTLPIK